MLLKPEVDIDVDRIITKMTRNISKLLGYGKPFRDGASSGLSDIPLIEACIFREKVQAEAHYHHYLTLTGKYAAQRISKINMKIRIDRYGDLHIIVKAVYMASIFFAKSCQDLIAVYEANPDLPNGACLLPIFRDAEKLRDNIKGNIVDPFCKIIKPTYVFGKCYH